VGEGDRGGPPASKQEQMKRISAAWAAGFFEGEGTVTIANNRVGIYTRIVVKISNTDIECLGFFQDRWPAGSIRLLHAATDKRRPAWEWRLQSGRAEKFLRDIRPYVRSKRVQTKIRLALKVQKNRYGVGRPTRPRMPPAEYHALHAEFRAQMRELNRRGVA
jgi:hypothetical protein